MPAVGQLLVGPAVEQVELADRGAAEAVDHQRDPVAGLVRQVGDDGLEQLVDDRRWRGFSFARRRPGSPWMPTPISISSSPSSNSGEPLAGGVQAVSAMPMVRVTLLTFSPIRDELVEVGALLGGRADRLHHEEVAGDAAAADRVGRVLHRDVVVDEERADRDVLGLGHLLRHLEGHPVAGVVVDQQQHALGRGDAAWWSPARSPSAARRRRRPDRRRRACPCRPPSRAPARGRSRSPGRSRPCSSLGRVGPHDQVVVRART